MRQERRGLSSVVGAIFMILVMAAGLNVALWTMQQQDRVTEAVVEKANSNLDKLNEEIEISDIRVSNNKLNMTVANTGGAAANLKSVYIINETAKMQYRYDIDRTVDGRNSVKIDTLPLVLKNDTSYSVKVVSMAGNTATSKITPLSTAALPMSLYVIPPTLTPNTNVTLLFTVTNNITDSNLAWAVVPKLQFSCNSCTLSPKVAPPSTPTMIGKGNTALFKWVYTVSAPDKTTVTFNASLTNAKQGNFVVEKGLVKLIESAQTSFSSEIIVSSTLVQKPEIFVIFPGPFGDATSNSDKGLWGVVVVNPTNIEMEVSRVVINAYTSKPASNHKMVLENCAKTPITPASSSEWTCPHDNMVEWKNVGSPQVINGYESKTFLVKIGPGDLGAGAEEPAFMLSVAVFTNMGQFTKTGFSSGMKDTASGGAQPLANIFMAMTNNTATVLSNNTKITGHLNKISPGQTVQLNVTIADFDTSSSTYIKSGSTLIVNVPRGFGEVRTVGSVGFNNPVITPFSDGSTQITAKLKTGGSSENLGDVASAEAKVLSIIAKAPVYNSTRVYIMHSLLDGETHTNFSVGAIAELALQVLCEDYPDCA